MSNPDGIAGPDEAAGHKPAGNYEVGYGKPPMAHRFKAGNKANPRGRRKGARNRKVIIQDVLLEPVTVREGQITRQMSALEAVLKKTMSKALSGDNKAALIIIGIGQKAGVLTAEQEQAIDDLSASDRAIIADVRRRMEDASLEDVPPLEEPATPGSVP
jgi:Family of unknown function (DUF5681)